VLLIGNGTSALDISRDISSNVKTIYQSIRESAHAFDERYIKLRESLSKVVPSNVQQIGGIKSFKHSGLDDIRDAVIELQDGSEITNIDYVIVCTGYVFNFHFLEELHNDPHVNGKLQTNVDDEHVLVKDGAQVFNLHKDIFYIPNPTLSFVGVPFHIATFSLFEFQSYTIARVYSDSAKLPTEEAMRAEWRERARQKGAGREFHALGNELEMAYIRDIVNWVNRDGKSLNKRVVEGHSDEWKNIREQSLPALLEALKLRL
jgi:lysine/ornithine N-monooxygenase